jgi:GNAT superfamily N-acetyltransferase
VPDLEAPDRSVTDAGHVARDAQARSGWQAGDRLTHSTRGPVTYVGHDERDASGVGGGSGGSGGAHWVEFGDGEAGMVSGERLSGYVPPAAAPAHATRSPNTAVAAPPPAAGLTPTRAAEVEDRVGAAYQQLVLARKGRDRNPHISIADLRAALSDIPRSELDQVLKRMDRNPHVSLVPETNQKTLTAQHRADALRIGDQDNHLISIDTGEPWRTYKQSVAPEPPVEAGTADALASAIPDLGPDRDLPLTHAPQLRRVIAHAYDNHIGGLHATLDPDLSRVYDGRDGVVIRAEGDIRDDAGNIVGGFRRLLHPTTRTVHNDMLAIAPEWQRRGFGRAFDDNADRVLTDAGYTRATISPAYEGGVAAARRGYGWDSTKPGAVGDVAGRVAGALAADPSGPGSDRLRGWLEAFRGDRAGWPTPLEIANSGPAGVAILDGSSWQGERRLGAAGDTPAQDRGGAPLSAADRAAALAEPQESPDLLNRLQQTEMDAARALAEMAIEVEELAAKDASTRAMTHRVRARMKRMRLEPIDNAGEEVAFDRRRHQLIGPDIRDGAPVVVVRPGYVWKTPSKDVLIERPVVQDHGPAETNRTDRVG